MIAGVVVCCLLLAIVACVVYKRRHSDSGSGAPYEYTPNDTPLDLATPSSPSMAFATLDPAMNQSQNIYGVYQKNTFWIISSI